MAILNQRQQAFIQQVLEKITEAIDGCADAESVTLPVGRKLVGKHVVKVTLVAERDSGFAAPLASHASTRPRNKPPLDVETEHRRRDRERRR